MYVSAVHVSVLIVNNLLGIGLLNIPYATKFCGVSNFIIILTVLALITFLTMTTIAYCSDISQAVTFEGAVRTVCGTTAYRITAVTVIFHSFTSCIIILFVIGDQWREVFLFTSRDIYCTLHPWYMHKTFIVPLTTVLFILPFCFLERIKFLAYPSGLGVLGIIYINVLVVIKYFTISDMKGSDQSRTSDTGSISLAVASIVFSYEGHLPIIPIYASMKIRTINNFFKPVSFTIIFCTMIYGLTGIFGYLTFGNSVTSNILLSYEPNTDIFVAVVMLSLKTYTIYPLLAFCGREAILSLWDELFDVSVEAKIKVAKKRRIIIASIWFILSLVAALYIPFFGILVRYQGVVAFLFVLIYPGLCLFLLKEDDTHPICWTIARLILAITLIGVGVFLMAMTLVQSIQTDIIHPEDIRPDTSQYTC